MSESGSMHLLHALLLGLVEGMTEFLPISSTGHLILAGHLLGLHDEKSKLFDVAIQTGAMLAVIWYYRDRFIAIFRSISNTEGPVVERQESIRLIANISLAFLPAAVLGLLFGKAIKDHLFHPVPVAIAFVLGGLIILWAERRVALYPQSVRVEALHRMSGLDALKVGMAQCFALIPGTSRSGATIIGGMLFGLSRQVATEFSFFLAIPTLIGAGLYDTWKYRDLLSWADAPAFLLGLTSAFVSALVVVHWLIRFVSNHSFTWFAWYRIAFGAIVLVSSYAGWVVWHA